MNQLLQAPPKCEKCGAEQRHYQNPKTGKSQWVCPECRKKYLKEWRDSQPKILQLLLFRTCEKCGVPIEKGRVCNSCKLKGARARNRRYHENNPFARQQEYERNYDDYQRRSKSYAEEHPEIASASQKKWRENNPGLSNAIRKERKHKNGVLVKLDSVDKAIVKAIYAKRDKTGLGGGLGPGYYNVDHIQPMALGGEHAPWNMAVISWEENGTKKARRPTLREVMRGERRYRLLRRMFENAESLGADARGAA